MTLVLRMAQYLKKKTLKKQMAQCHFNLTNNTFSFSSYFSMLYKHIIILVNGTMQSLCNISGLYYVITKRWVVFSQTVRITSTNTQTRESSILQNVFCSVANAQEHTLLPMKL